MKKILLVIFMLFNFSFASETGYIWLPGVENEIDTYRITSNTLYLFHPNKIYLKGEEIKILKGNIILKDVENSINLFRNLSKKEICYLNFHDFLYFFKEDTIANDECNIRKYNLKYFILEKDVIVKVKFIEKFIEGIFLEIEFL